MNELRVIEKPVRPILKGVVDIKGDGYTICGSCEEMLYAKHNYCPNCGVKIDWQHPINERTYNLDPQGLI